MVSYDRAERALELIERLAEEEEKLKIFLDSSPWGILVVDKTFHVVFINETMERMSGYRAGEIMGEHMHILLPREHHEIHVAHEKTYAKNPHHRVGNHGLKPKLLTKSGSIVPVEISLSPTKVGGRTMYYASIRPLESLYNTISGTERNV